MTNEIIKRCENLIFDSFTQDDYCAVKGNSNPDCSKCEDYCE